MSGDELARLRAVCEAATPGPWRMTESGTHAGPAVVWGVHCDVVTSANALSDDEDDRLDFRAIAALGSLWPELLAVVEAVTDEHGCIAACADEVDALRAAIRERLGDGDD